MNNKYGVWWLRDINMINSDGNSVVAGVGYYGMIGGAGRPDNDTETGVRPALWKYFF